MSAVPCVHSVTLCKRLLALPPARMESKPLYVGQLSMGWACLWHTILRSTFAYSSFTLLLICDLLMVRKTYFDRHEWAGLTFDRQVMHANSCPYACLQNLPCQVDVTAVACHLLAHSTQGF